MWPARSMRYYFAIDKLDANEKRQKDQLLALSQSLTILYARTGEPAPWCTNHRKASFPNCLPQRLTSSVLAGGGVGSISVAKDGALQQF